MNIIIDIANAPKQKEIIENIDKSYCKIKDTQVTIVGIYNEDKRVHDVYRYNLIITNNSNYKLEQLDLDKDCKFFEKSRFNDYKAKDVHNNNSTIVLVIESPHRDEYTESFQPIAPAQCTTGSKISKYISDILKQQNFDNGKYNIIICNPVQFQASLYSLHKLPLSGKNTSVAAIRDKVWKEIFRLEEDNFKKRVQSYKPTIIINACTAKLKELVTKKIYNTIKCDLYQAETHPCIWSSNTELKKIKESQGV